MQDLSTNEREQLRSWQRRLVTAFCVTITGLLIVVAADLVFGFSPRGALLAFSALLALALTAIVIQFSQKCPRCGYRLGRQTCFLIAARSAGSG
jgi:cation transporter-like permease